MIRSVNREYANQGQQIVNLASSRRLFSTSSYLSLVCSILNSLIVVISRCSDKMTPITLFFEYFQSFHKNGMMIWSRYQNLQVAFGSSRSVMNFVLLFSYSFSSFFAMSLICSLSLSLTITTRVQMFSASSHCFTILRTLSMIIAALNPIGYDYSNPPNINQNLIIPQRPS